MAKHQVNTFDQGKVSVKANESELVNDILKREFLKWMSENGYPFEYLKEIFEGKKMSASEQSNFNETIRDAKKENNISLIDIVILFEENFNKFKKILSVLDGETKYELKKELSKKYYIRLDETNLSQILG